MGFLATLAVTGSRTAIDHLDDAMILLLAGRRGLVAGLARNKSRAGLSRRDTLREQQVRLRARRLAMRVRLPADCADELMSLLIDHALRQQRDADAAAASFPVISANGSDMPLPESGPPRTMRWLLRMLPPPRRWKPLLALLPESAQQAAVRRMLSHAVSSSLRDSAFAVIERRRLGIEISDMGLQWVLELRGDRLAISQEAAEATVCGTATDLLLLASRLEDADTLFFQRRLMLTGDTELGLTVRNLLDRLPWESVPLGLRIVLHRSGRLARDARALHHASA